MNKINFLRPGLSKPENIFSNHKKCFKACILHFSSYGECVLILRELTFVRKSTLGESVFNPELQEEEAGESWARDEVNYDVWEK